MNQWKWIAAIGVLTASVCVLIGMGGCTTTYEKVTRPDGTTVEHWEIEFRPNMLPNLLNYDVHYYGKTQQGLPIKEWVPKHGGESLYEVEGKFFAKKPTAKPPVLTARQPSGEVDEFEAEAVGSGEFSISADFLADTAELFERMEGTEQWQIIVGGDLESVVRAALRRGLGAMDFENEFGTWSIRVDAPIPVVVTRLNGEILDVRWCGPLGKPALETSIHQRCR
ncbi:MAG: hypothetical protein K8R92_00380 [Planctomycetes bacterium]|nr:hypothetical protein [Planctomycetota bacterium]